MNYEARWRWWYTPLFNPSILKTEVGRQISKFNVNLLYRMSFRTVRATQTLSQKKTKTNQTKWNMNYETMNKPQKLYEAEQTQPNRLFVQNFWGEKTYGDRE